MNIEPSRGIKTQQTTDVKDVKIEKTDERKKDGSPVSFQQVEAQIKQTIDKATGVLQTIVSDQLSDKVIRKIPPDEYLQMLNMIDEMISGSVDKKV